jgi:hypothetical protein
MQPFFSPEGRHIGFFAKGKLLTAPLSVGRATALADVSYLPYGGTGAHSLAFIVYSLPEVNPKD